MSDVDIISQFDEGWYEIILCTLSLLIMSMFIVQSANIFANDVFEPLAVFSLVKLKIMSIT